MGIRLWELVAAATSVPGKMMERITGQSQLGTIQEGGPADLVLIEGDVSADIGCTRHIRQVIAGGQVVERRKPSETI